MGATVVLVVAGSLRSLLRFLSLFDFSVDVVDGFSMAAVELEAVFEGMA